MIRTSPANAFSLWPGRLAQRVAPDEADVAEELALAYAAGGDRRKQLFPGDTTGAFLPHLWRALDTAYPMLRALLSDSVVANVVPAARGVFSRRRSDKGRARLTGPASRWINTTIDMVRDALLPAGLPSAEAERIALDIVEEMMGDPASAADFLDRLGVHS